MALSNESTGIFSTFSIFFVIAALIAIGLFLYVPNANEFSIFIKVTALAAIFSLIPTLTHKLVNIEETFKNFLIETVLFSLFVLIFNRIIFSNPIFNIWVAYAIGLILLIEFGGYLIENYSNNKLGSASMRLTRIMLEIDGESEISNIEKTLQLESFTFLAIPVGAAIGTFYAISINLPLEDVLLTSLESIFLISSGILFILNINLFWQMCHPIFRPKSINEAQSTSRTDRDTNLLGNILKKIGLLKTDTSEKISAKQNIERWSIELAQTVSELRSIYFYDSMHNGILIIAFLPISWPLLELDIDVRVFIFSSLIGLFILNCLPYWIGQNLFHTKLLSVLKTHAIYENNSSDLVEISEKLKRWAPSIVISNFLSLFISVLLGNILNTFMVTLIEQTNISIGPP